jgi:serine protease
MPNLLNASLPFSPSLNPTLDSLYNQLAAPLLDPVVGLTVGRSPQASAALDPTIQDPVTQDPATLDTGTSDRPSGATTANSIDLSTAIPIGSLNGRWVTTNSVGNRAVGDRDWWDIYQFQINAPSDLDVVLTGLSVNANVFLVRDWNGNNQIDLGDDSEEVLDGSINPGVADDAFRTLQLPTGIYYVLVSTTELFTNYSLTLTSDAAGSTFATARNLGFVGGTFPSRTVQDYVGPTDPDDIYRFQLSTASDVRIDLTNLSADADLFLARDANGNGRLDVGELIDSSILAGTTPDAIPVNGLAAGTYFIYVVPGVSTAATNYRLSLSAVPTNNVVFLAGSLGADRFTPSPTNRRTVISGNGNVDFGQGLTDELNLSTVFSTSARLNLTRLTGGGVAYDPGNGLRLFDSLTFSDGRQILFEGLDEIRFADVSINLANSPNDPLFGQQWNLHMMGVHTAWQLTTGSTQVAIGIQDTGLGFSAAGFIHTDLRTTRGLISTGNMADEFFREIDDEDFGFQPTSHGTAVQGIIAAVTNNQTGISGINWNSPMFNLDVLDGNVGDLTLAQATQYLVDNTVIAQGQRLVVNLSIGGGTIRPDFEQLVARYANQVLFVIAAGNDDVSLLDYPATLAQRYGNVIAVGASWGRTDADGFARTPGTSISYPRATLNHGIWGSNYGPGLTVMGPSEVPTTKASRVNGQTQFSYYDRRDDRFSLLDRSDNFNGTSAAAPNVAGVASLVWSANPTLTAGQVRQILSDTAYDLGAAGYDLVYGHGFVNADAAVRRAIALDSTRLTVLA